MPAKKKTKNTKKNEKPMRFSFLSDMNPDKKSNLLKVTGVIVMVFAVLTLCPQCLISLPGWRTRVFFPSLI